jgi:thiol:disulfide interchange protein DsbD
VQVALRQKIDKGWHTYWRNPGDSGEATKIAWTLPPGWTAGEIVWPTPSRQPTGPLMNYGYAGEVLLPVAIMAPADARPGKTATLKAHATFLVCADICVPEEAELALSLPVTSGPAPADPTWGKRVEKAFADAPKPAAITAAFTRKADGTLGLAAVGPAIRGADLADAYFYPFDGAVIDHAGPQGIERGPEGLTLSLTPGLAFQRGGGPASLAGVLALGDRAFEITARAGPAPPGAAGLGPPMPKSPTGGGLGLAGAALFAFLGGLILNLMPCVFPVLAMKAASLTAHGSGVGAARRQGLAFLVGVMATFLALAGLLIALKAGGSAIGWGFQLQSPPVVAALCLLMLAVALNLSGVFEAGQALQGAGGAFADRRGTAGAFLTGALAVVVAAPCTAPFMAPAIGWALVQGPAPALAVFAALGFGFAAPFAGLAFVPALMRRLPKPGPWMEGLRRALAFPMYGAAAWLAWVLSVQAGEAALARLLAAAVVTGCAAWLWGLAQRRRAEGRSGRVPGAVAAGMMLAVLAATVGRPYDGSGAPSAGNALTSEAWSPERLAAARASGRPVFVNFTAAWCVTCQVNERTALSRPGVARAFQRAGAVYLKGDWTRKDEAIEAELARHGRAGVPLYLVYGAKGGAPVILPQILSEGLVARAIEDARGR